MQPMFLVIGDGDFIAAYPTLEEAHDHIARREGYIESCDFAWVVKAEYFVNIEEASDHKTA